MQSLEVKGAAGEDFAASGAMSLASTLQRDAAGYFHVGGRGVFRTAVRFADARVSTEDTCTGLAALAVDGDEQNKGTEPAALVTLFLRTAPGSLGGSPELRVCVTDPFQNMHLELVAVERVAFDRWTHVSLHLAQPADAGALRQFRAVTTPRTCLVDLDAFRSAVLDEPGLLRT